MATRTISTRLAIEGEAQYRAAITKINNELKTQQSALKMVESQYKANASSMEALTAKEKALNDLHEVQRRKVDELKAALENAKTAEAAYQRQKEELTEKLRENEQAMERLKQSAKDTSKEQEALTAENAELNKQLTDCGARLEAAEKGVNDWQGKLNTAQGALYDLDEELRQNKRAQEQAKEKTKESARAAEQHSEATKGQVSQLNALASALAVGGVNAGLEKLAAALKSCVDASADFESAMAGVKKTTDLTDEELRVMGDRFKELSTKMPATAVELAGIAEAAGQLGIQKDKLVDFSVVMANLGVSTNLTSEEAATLLARFANVTGMDPSLYENLGSAVVALGNNLATTESEIVNMGQRLSAAGKLAGLTEPEIMALSAAMSSVGIEAEAGGTAMTQTLTAMEKAVAKGGESLDGFARIAGMSAEEFSAAWQSSPITAVQAFIGGLGGLQEQGESATMALEDLGLTGIRQGNMLKSLGLASDVLSESIETANTAWTENTALATEAATRYSTTESRFKMLENSVTNLKAAVGDQLNPALGRLAETGGDVLAWAADFIEENEWLVPTIAGVTATLGVLTVATTGYTVVTEIAIPLIKSFNAALASNPVGLVAVGLTAAIAGFAAFCAFIEDDTVPSIKELTSAAREAKETMEELDTSLSDSLGRTEAAAKTAEGYIQRLEELEAAGLRTDEQQQEYHNILALLCETVPELSQYIDLQTDKINGGTEALRVNVKAWEENARAQAYQEKLTEILKRQAEVEIEKTRNSIRETEATESLKAAQSRLLEVEDQLNKVRDEYRVEEDAEKAEKLREELEKLGSEQEELTRTIQQSSADALVYNQAVSEGEEALQNVKDEANLTEKAIKKLTGAQEDGSAATEDYTKKQQELQAVQEQQEEAHKNLRDRIGELAQKYRDALDAARDSISGQMGLFGEFSATATEDTMSVESMITRMGEQTQAVERYTENLKKAAELNISEGLVKALSDGSEESAQYLDKIVRECENADQGLSGLGDSSGEVVDKINKAFSEKEISIGAFSKLKVSLDEDLQEYGNALAQAARDADFSEFQAAMTEAFQKVEIDYKAVGANFAEGLSGGMAEGKEKVVFTMEEVGSATLDELRSIWREHSPSLAAKELAGNFMEGLDQGFLGKKEQLCATVDSLGEELTTRTREAMERLKSAVTNTLSPLPDYMAMIGEQMANGMISGISRRESALYGKIAQVVDSAIKTGNETAQVHSPSKRTTQMFEFVGDGMILGLENRRDKLKDTSRSVTEEALNIDFDGGIARALEKIDSRPPAVLAMPWTAANERQAEKNSPSYQITVEKGAVTITAEGQDPDELYRTLTRRMQREVESKQRSLGR